MQSNEDLALTLEKMPTELLNMSYCTDIVIHFIIFITNYSDTTLAL